MNELYDIIDMPIPEFELFIETLPMGELMSLKNFLASTYEQIRQAKDNSIEALIANGTDDIKQDALVEVYAKLFLIEEKHNRVKAVIEGRK